jgi:hypothetical protein
VRLLGRRSFVRTAAPLALALGASVALVPSAARACGVSTADGLSACSLAEHEEAERPRWHAGASGVYTSTAIRFAGTQTDAETRGSLVASLAYQPTPRLSFQLAAGATLGGKLETPAGRYDFSSGPTAAVGASWRAVTGTRPFVLVTSNLSFSAATTRPSAAGGAGASNASDPAATYAAFDLRVGALVGTTLWHVLSPYGVARVFGGPVFWTYQGASVTGTDTHHYQLGAGLTVNVARRANVFAEGIPLGERALSAGAAFAF